MKNKLERVARPEGSMKAPLKKDNQTTRNLGKETVVPRKRSKQCRVAGKKVPEKGAKNTVAVNPGFFGVVFLGGKGGKKGPSSKIKTPLSQGGD